VLGALESQHATVLEVADALERRPLANRPVPRHRPDAEHLLQLVEQRERLAAGTIELVDEGHDRDASSSTHLEELPGPRLDALRRVEHHHRAVDGGQRAVRILAEILVAGRVQQVEATAAEVELQRGRRDRDAGLPLDRHPVGPGVSPALVAADGAGQVDGAGVEEQLLGERRLARVGMGDDREGPTSGSLARDIVGPREPGFPPHDGLGPSQLADAYRRQS
jgi:hypothetical protein